MAFKIYLVGSLIAVLGVAGIYWIYHYDLMRLRLRVIRDDRTEPLPGDLWAGVAFIAIAVISPLAVIYYATRPQTAPREGANLPPTENKYVCTSTVSPIPPDKYAALVELGVRQQDTNGVVAVVAVEKKYTTASFWMGQPLHTDTANNGGVFSMKGERKSDRSYQIQFVSPNITKNQSLYIYLGGQDPVSIIEVLYLENFYATADQLNAQRRAAQYGECPR